MSTETAEPPVTAAKNGRKVRHYVVTRGGVECGYGLKKYITRSLRFSRGVLIPTPPAAAPHQFSTLRAADRAIRKTEQAIMMLGGFTRTPDGQLKSTGTTLVSDMWQLAPLLRAPGAFAVKEV